MKDREKILIDSIAELKMIYDSLESSFEVVKNRFIIFTTAQLGILTFLYTGQNKPNQLFFPEEMYGRIFYCIGLVFTGISLYHLITGIKAVSWTCPPESIDLKKSEFRNYIEFLTYLKNQYYDAIQVNLQTYEKKLAKLGIVLNSMMAGTGILMIIKIFVNI